MSLKNLYSLQLKEQFKNFTIPPCLTKKFLILLTQTSFNPAWHFASHLKKHQKIISKSTWKRNRKSVTRRD